MPGAAGDGGLATAAELKYPSEIAVDSSGNVFIADALNARIRKVEAATGVIRTIAGTGVAGFSGDGGPATQAELRSPGGVAVGRNGDVYVADTYNYRIRKVDAQTGVIVTIAGLGAGTGYGTGTLATLARIGDVTSLALDPEGNLYFTEAGYNVVRVLRKETGVVSTVVGSGRDRYAGDDGPATLAQLWTPTRVALDGGGNLYVSDTSNQRIRFVRSVGPLVTFPTAGAVVTAVAGTGSVAISTTPADLAWTATSSASWLTLGATTGTGGGTIGFNYTANPGFGMRSAAISVNGAGYTVRQAGVSVTLTANAAPVRSGAGSGTFGVTVAPAVAWTAVSTAPWLTVTAGSGTVQFSYSANPLTVGRMGTIVVGGEAIYGCAGGSERSSIAVGFARDGYDSNHCGNGYRWVQRR